MLLEALRADVVMGAKSILGCELVFQQMRARIVEVEAYGGSDDPASHAFRGQTPRNTVMFGPPGYAYVYFNYGCHWMLNISSLNENQPAAILIRAAEPMEGLEVIRENRGGRPDKDLLSGPGKLCQGFGITKRQNGMYMLADGELRIEEGIRPRAILAGPRVGIKVGTERMWRFVDADKTEWVCRSVSAHLSE